MTEVVTVVAVPGRLIGEWRCFLRGRTSLMSHSGSLTRAWISWCACLVASAGPLENTQTKKAKMKTVLLKTVKYIYKWKQLIMLLSGPRAVPSN